MNGNKAENQSIHQFKYFLLCGYSTFDRKQDESE
jgi:hypothetical protein